MFKNTLKGREKEAEWLDISGPKGRHSGEFPEFSFCLIHPIVGTEQACKPEMPKGMDQGGKCQPEAASSS